MRTVFLFVFSVLSIAIVYAIDRHSPSSIKNLILHETQEIQEAELQGADDLSLKYINRAESYIVAGTFEKALEDLEKGYAVACQRSQRNVEQRSLLDMMVTYAYLGDDEKALLATEHFQSLFYSSDDHTPKKWRLCKDENYVSGPDEEPAPGWCRETVNSTTDFLKKLVKDSRLSKATQESLNFTLDQLHSSGLRCCASGGRWKECVGPLAKKAVEWQASGVPADPQWN